LLRRSDTARGKVDKNYWPIINDENGAGPAVKLPSQSTIKEIAGPLPTSLARSTTTRFCANAQDSSAGRSARHGAKVIIDQGG